MIRENYNIFHCILRLRQELFDVGIKIVVYLNWKMFTQNKIIPIKLRYSANSLL